MKMISLKLGTITGFLAGAAIASGQQPNNVQKYSAATPAPTLEHIINAATFQENKISTAAFASALGTTGLDHACVPDQTAQTLPTNLCGIHVRVNGADAYLTYADGRQVNFIIPDVTGTSKFILANNERESAPLNVDVKPAAIGFFRRGNNLGAIVSNDTIVMSYENPVRTPIMWVYSTGAGFSGDLHNLNYTPGQPLPTGQLFPTPPPDFSVDGQPLPPANTLFNGYVMPGLWQHNIRLPLLGTGVHTLTGCLWGSCDTIEFLIAQPGEQTLAGNISDLHGKPQTFAGIYRQVDKDIPITTSPSGNFTIATTASGTFQISQAADKYALLTVPNVNTNTLFKQMIPWREDTNLNKNYLAKPYDILADPTGGQHLPDFEFTESTTPINNIMIQHYNTLMLDGSSLFIAAPQYPIPVYLGLLPQEIQNIIQTCPTPWNNNEIQTHVITTEDPRGKLPIFAVVQEIQNGADLRYDKIDGEMQGEGMKYTSLEMTVELGAEITDKNLVCQAYKHELGHSLRSFHWPKAGGPFDQTYVMNYAQEQILDSPFEDATLPEVTLFNISTTNMNNYSWTRTTSTLDSAPTFVNTTSTPLSEYHFTNSSLLDRRGGDQVIRTQQLDDHHLLRTIRHYQPEGSTERFYDSADIVKQ